MQQLINWNEAYGSGKDYAVLYTAALSELIETVPQDTGKKHLDVGCGTGQMNRDMYHRGYETVGVDPSNVAIRLAQSSVSNSDGRITFIAGDIFSLQEQRFDLITCKYVYTFITDKEAFLTRVSELLVKKGVFVLISPNMLTLNDDKKSIGLPDEDVFAQLSKHFITQRKLKDRDIYYFCMHN